MHDPRYPGPEYLLYWADLTPRWPRPWDLVGKQQRNVLPLSIGRIRRVIRTNGTYE